MWLVDIGMFKKKILIFLGGIVDIIVYEKLDEGLLKEFYKVSGGVCGGIVMDFKVLGVLEEIVGNEVFSEFKRRYVEGYMDLFREIEVFKRNIKFESDGKINMVIFYVFFDEICFKMCNKYFKDFFVEFFICKYIFFIVDKFCFSVDFVR